MPSKYSSSISGTLFHENVEKMCFSYKKYDAPTLPYLVVSCDIETLNLKFIFQVIFVLNVDVICLRTKQDKQMKISAVILITYFLCC